MKDILIGLQRRYSELTIKQRQLKIDSNDLNRQYSEGRRDHEWRESFRYCSRELLITDTTLSEIATMFDTIVEKIYGQPKRSVTKTIILQKEGEEIAKIVDSEIVKVRHAFRKEINNLNFEDKLTDTDLFKLISTLQCSMEYIEKEVIEDRNINVFVIE